MASNVADQHLPKLRNLAIIRLTQLLEKSVTKMNNIIAAEILKSSQSTCANAALQMMKVRKYLMCNNNPSKAMMYCLTPEVVQKMISAAVDTLNIGLIRLIVCGWTEKLDFRAIDYPSNRYRKELPEFEDSTHSTFPLPPNEFDWFARDRVGKIMTADLACEIFSIVGMSQCSGKLKEFHLNARRPEYWSCSPEIMELTFCVLQQMNNLTTLVIRGFCDDGMLQIIGKNCPELRHLDISGSHFLTDSGLKSLFFEDVIENPAIYLVKSFIEKNLIHMNGLVNTLQVLDYSWTNVSSLGRKMVQYLPGAFVFKRMFALGENYEHGHHIFIRKKPLFKSTIPTRMQNETTTQFERSLFSHFTTKNVKAFLKFSEQHPWKNCFLQLYDKVGVPLDSVSEENYTGIITHSEDEKRIYGIVHFDEGLISEIYSIFPVNLNVLGESCPKLEVFRGTVTDIWRMNTSVLSDLTELDMFAEPATIKNVLESVPNLRKFRIRVLKQQLTDDHITKPLTTFMCCRTLEELWIAPGTYKKEAVENTVKNCIENVDKQWRVFNEVHANYYSGENTPRLKRKIEDLNKNSYSNELERQDCQIEDLVQLTDNCLRTLLKSCQKLNRIGDIAMWSLVPEQEVKIISEEMQNIKRNVAFIWENKIVTTNSK